MERLNEKNQLALAHYAIFIAGSASAPSSHYTINNRSKLMMDLMRVRMIKSISIWKYH